MLFKIDLDKKIRDLNPEIDIIPALKELSDRTLKYVFLVYDYKSPYRELPIKERKEKVGFLVGFKRETGKQNRFDKNAREIMSGRHPRTERAINAFKDLIYDSDRDTYQAIDDLITNIRDFIRTPDPKGLEMEKKAKLAKEIPSLSQTKKQLAQILEIKDKEYSDEDDTGQEEISTLEMIHEGIL